MIAECKSFGGTSGKPCRDTRITSNATCPAVAESGGVEGGSAAAAPSCAAFLRHDPAALANHEFGCVGPANASACGASGTSSSALSLSDCCAAIAPYRGADCTMPPAAPPAAPSPPPSSPPALPTGAVSLGPSGNSCPTGSSKLTTIAECRAGMELLGLSGERGDGGLQGTETEASWPAGCYYCRNVDGCTNGVWLNNHQTGSANGGAKPLCGINFVPLAQGELLLVGDSDIDYWHNTYTTFPRSHNVGVGGDTCKNVRNEADAMLAAFAPSWVLLVCGENDLAAGQSVSATMARLRSAVEKMVAAGARVLYIGTKPERDSQGLWDQYVDYDAAVLEYAASLAATAVGRPPLVFIDSYQGFNDLSNPTSLYASDELHLSGEGYTMWESWAQLALSPSPADAQCFAWRSGLCVRSSLPPAVPPATPPTVPPATPPPAPPPPSPPPPSPSPSPPGAAAPYPSPPLASGEVRVEVHTAVLEVVAAGAVSDYGEAELASLRTSIAAAASVDANNVSITIAPGSVIVTAKIAAPSAAAATLTAEHLASQLGSSASASTLLNISVEDTPAVRATTEVVIHSAPSQLSPPPLPPPPSPPPPPLPPSPPLAPPPAPPLPSVPSPSLRPLTVLAPPTPDLAAPSPSLSPPPSSPGTPTLPAEAGTEADMAAESSGVLSTGAIVGIVAALAAVLLLGLCIALIVTGKMRVVTGVRIQTGSRFRLKRREEPHFEVGRLGPPAVMSEIAVFAVGEGASEATLPGQPDTVPHVEFEIKV